MYKYRFLIGKGEEIRYISHLEFMRAIERGLRRARIPVALTEGFNKHYKISFASALSVNEMSLGEAVEVELLVLLSEHELLTRLASSFPPGLRVTSVEMIEREDSVIGCPAVIHYRVLATIGNDIDKDSLYAKAQSFMNDFDGVIEVRHKEGFKSKNVFDYLKDVRIGNTENNIQEFFLSIASSSSGSVRASDVMKAFASYSFDDDLEVIYISRSRTDYKLKDGRLISK